MLVIDFIYLFFGGFYFLCCFTVCLMGKCLVFALVVGYSPKLEGQEPNRRGIAECVIGIVI